MWCSRRHNRVHYYVHVISAYCKACNSNNNQGTLKAYSHGQSFNSTHSSLALRKSLSIGQTHPGRHVAEQLMAGWLSSQRKGQATAHLVNLRPGGHVVSARFCVLVGKREIYIDRERGWEVFIDETQRSQIKCSFNLLYTSNHRSRLWLPYHHKNFTLQQTSY